MQVAQLDQFLGLEADPHAATECAGRHRASICTFVSMWPSSRSDAVCMFPLVFVRRTDFPETTKVPTAPLTAAIRKLYFANSKKDYEPNDFGTDYDPASSQSSVAPACSESSCDIVAHIRRGDRADKGDKLSDAHFIPDNIW